jgi:hypothetical protein
MKAHKSANPSRWSSAMSRKLTDKRHAEQAKPQLKVRPPALVTATPAVLAKRGS